jgi:hypothetical protein
MIQLLYFIQILNYHLKKNSSSQMTVNYNKVFLDYSFLGDDLYDSNSLGKDSNIKAEEESLDLQ